MALKGRFFNSSGGDRKYSAEDFAQYFKQFIGNGVFFQDASKMRVGTSTGYEVRVSPGFAFIEGRLVENDSDFFLTVPPRNPSAPRLDSVILRLNLPSRLFEILILEGNPSANPVPPAPVRSATIYDLVLAHIRVNPDTDIITNSNIIDTRLNSDLCGIVTGVVDQIDAEELFSQLTQEFNDWFDTIRGQLSGDLAGALQLEIDELRDTKANVLSPQFEGTVTAPTPNVNSNNTIVATTEFVNNHFENRVHHGIVNVNVSALNTVSSVNVGNFGPNAIMVVTPQTSTPQQLSYSIGRSASGDLGIFVYRTQGSPGNVTMHYQIIS